MAKDTDTTAHGWGKSEAPAATTAEPPHPEDDGEDTTDVPVDSDSGVWTEQDNDSNPDPGDWPGPNDD